MLCCFYCDFIYVKVLVLLLMKFHLCDELRTFKEFAGFLLSFFTEISADFGLWPLPSPVPVLGCPGPWRHQRNFLSHLNSLTVPNIPEICIL